MKSLDFNSISTNNFTENLYKPKRIVCRLCARGCTESQAKSIFELNSILVKCLPNIRLNTLDNLSDEVCGDCIKKLVKYSSFIDRVVSVQKEFFGVNTGDADSVHHAFNECVEEPTRNPIIIKQEPIANIKQEIFEFNKSSRMDIIDNNGGCDVDGLNKSNVEDPLNGSGQDYYTDAESDAYCEFCDVYFINNVELKNHIVDFHTDHPCNPRERANNCEIMEIITLENAAFIDLDNCVEETATVPQLERVLKVEQQTDIDPHDMSIQIISVEHNYASTLGGVVEDGSIVRNLKQEEIIGPVKLFTQTRQVEQSAVNGIESLIDPLRSAEQTLNELIVTEHLSEKCTKCSHVFETQISLNEHMQTVHTPKTKICPICTAHCQTVYHYFVHRSKYHNWSKPRRPKRKFHYKCHDCSKTFWSKFAFDNHNKYSCTSLRFKCSICHLEFSSGMSMLIHKRICKVLMAKMDTGDSHRRMKILAHRKDTKFPVRSTRKALVRSTKSVSFFSFSFIYVALRSC